MTLFGKNHASTNTATPVHADHHKGSHVSSHKPTEAHGPTALHPTLGQKIKGEKEVMMGKATHDPHRVLEGEMLKGNQVHISSGAPSTGLMNAQR